MSASIIAPMIGMVVGAGCYVAATAWRLGQRIDMHADVFGGMAIAAFVGGVVAYNLAAWLGMVSA